MWTCFLNAALLVTLALGGPSDHSWELWSQYEHEYQHITTSPVDVADFGASTLRDVEKVVILGAGPAGLATAIYAGRANLDPLVVAADAGQLAGSPGVENYPGCAVPATGTDIVNGFKDQAKTFGARFRAAWVVSVDLENRPFSLTLDGGEVIKTNSVVIATGASTLWMGTPSETKYRGHGVSSCATCDGYFFKGLPVAVIGGGDTAMEEALFLSRICPSVTVIHRRNQFRASKILADRVISSPKIKVMWDSEVEEFYGSGEKLSHVLVRNLTNGELVDIEVSGAFVAIGHKPNSQLFRGTLEMDDFGYIKTFAKSTATSVEGVFAAGDVADNVYRQAITSAGAGAMAALDAERWLCRLGC